MCFKVRGACVCVRALMHTRARARVRVCVCACTRACARVRLAHAQRERLGVTEALPSAFPSPHTDTSQAPRNHTPPTRLAEKTPTRRLCTTFALYKVCKHILATIAAMN